MTKPITGPIQPRRLVTLPTHAIQGELIALLGDRPKLHLGGGPSVPVVPVTVNLEDVDGLSSALASKLEGPTPLIPGKLLGVTAGGEIECRDTPVWDEIQGKPTEFPPAPHAHPAVSWADVQGKPTEFTPTTHTHDDLLKAPATLVPGKILGVGANRTIECVDAAGGGSGGVASAGGLIDRKTVHVRNPACPTHPLGGLFATTDWGVLASLTYTPKAVGSTLHVVGIAERQTDAVSTMALGIRIDGTEIARNRESTGGYWASTIIVDSDFGDVYTTTDIAPILIELLGAKNNVGPVEQCLLTVEEIASIVVPDYCIGDSPSGRAFGGVITRIRGYNCGSLPDNAILSIPHGLTTTIVRSEGRAEGPNGEVLNLPNPYPDQGMYSIGLWTDATYIHIRTGCNRTAYLSTVWLEYVP